VLSRNDLIMAMGYRPVHRDQLFLLALDMREWLPERHFVWFLLAVVEQLDVSGFERGRRLGGVGREGYDPRMLLALLIYGYAMGQRSSRRIEDLCVTDVAFRVICAQDVPDHTTICRFRQQNRDAVVVLFTQVLELAGEAGLGRVGTVALDGTRIAANASHGANRRRSWLRQRVEQMMAEADRVDAEEGTRFGAENGSLVDRLWCDPASRGERIKAALLRADEAADRLSAPQRDRVERQRRRVARAERRVVKTQAGAAQRQQRYQQRRADAEARSGSGARPTGRPAVRPEQAHDTKKALARLAAERARLAAAEVAAAEALAAQDRPANITDPDSGWMPTGKGWIQGYNTQLAVSDDQIVLAVKVTNATIDVAQFEPMMAAANAGAGIIDRGRVRAGAEPEPIQLLLADAGYLSEDNLSLPGPDRLIATTKRQRLEAMARHAQVVGQRSELIEQMSIRLATKAGIQAYRRRGVTVEPVNGHLKDRHGLRQFSCRGLKAAQAEVELAAATANLKKIWRSRN
jgi:transposase